MTGSNDERRGSRRKTSARLATLIGLVLAVAATATVVAAGNVEGQAVRPVDVHGTSTFWTSAAKPAAIPGRTAAVHAASFRSLRLDTAALGSVLALAPRENTLAAETSPLVVSLPAPNGKFQLFELHESAVMAPGLAARHPGIRTYSGLGLTDRAATIHTDLTPLGFHASVRSARGTWYIDPYFVGRASTPYASYYARDAKNTDGVFVEHEPASGPSFGGAESPDIGEQLRTYRLALITDPGYTSYFGGPPNVTPAKVALMNRVDQVYEDDMSIRLQLIANNDLLNLDTWGQATAPNGPCGAAACFTQSQVTGCSSTSRARYVIGQIIGASSYDIGHLALGQPGGGVANLGVVGRSNKAGGCTGVPTPVGDLYAIDYVAHEMGHQFGGNHTFNGNQLNCSGGNRSGPTSVEPGSGQSIMAYAGICLTDDEQPHSDGYFSERSQQEINAYVSSNQAAISEVQTVSLRHFGGGDERQAVTFGPGYAKTAAITPLSVNINAAPSASSRGGAQENGRARRTRSRSATR
jgi:Metallo-peptidase family M12B Reprolysin-like